MKEKTIYALGFFDGVHLGHQALLQNCREMADLLGCKAGVVTFTSHPDTLVRGETPGLICTPGDRRCLLEQGGMDTVLELPFDEKLMKMHWQEFICLLRSEYSAAGFVCGEDFRFGHLGQGNADILQQYCAAAGMPCKVVPEQTLDGVRVSSSHIRQLLEAGDMAQAVRFLGHPYMLSGEVVSGRKLGHTIGIPTANIQIPDNVLLPRSGVYACKVFVDGKTFLAVTNIGSRPTVGGHHITVEPWILDFQGDLYGKRITLAFYEFLRPEKKFDSLEELQREVQKNAEETRDFFKN